MKTYIITATSRRTYAKRCLARSDHSQMFVSCPSSARKFANFPNAQFIADKWQTASRFLNMDFAVEELTNE